MGINKNASKIWKFCVLQADFFLLKLVGTVAASSIISSFLITESSIIFAKHLPFLQLHVA